MYFKKLKFVDLTAEQWDAYVRQIPYATFFHSWIWINYLSAFAESPRNESYIGVRGNTPVVVCPLFVCRGEDGITSLTSPGGPLPPPAVWTTLATERRTVMRNVFDIFHELAKESGAKKISLASDPLTFGACKNQLPFSANSFELLDFGFWPHVYNSVVVDLSKTDEELFQNLSQSRRRIIRSSEKNGLQVNVHNSQSDPSKTDECFNRFEEAHLASAGKRTRRKQTWEWMRKAIEVGSADLFVCVKESTEMSYLFCGRNELISFGWSQVNIDEYEHEHSPRHLLEWQAILHYKRLGLKFYEVGEVYNTTQMFKIPNQKEISISDFKERFGGMLLNRTQWWGYFDKRFEKEEITKEFTKVLEARGTANE